MQKYIPSTRTHDRLAYVWADLYVGLGSSWRFCCLWLMTVTNWPLLLIFVLVSTLWAGCWVDHILPEDESVSYPVEQVEIGRDIVDRLALELSEVPLDPF